MPDSPGPSQGSAPSPPRLRQPAWKPAIRPLVAAIAAPVLRSPLLTARSRPTNPAFDPAPETLDALEQSFRAETRPLDRPLVVLGGWRSPPTVAASVAARLIALTSHDQRDALTISYPFRGDIRAIASRVSKHLRRTLEHLPEGSREIDIVGISMGGLVARTLITQEASAPCAVHRLFTIGTPHLGARLASTITTDRAGRQMRPGSDFLADLQRAHDRDPEAVELICYTNLNDRMVGAQSTAPAGRTPIWLPGTRVLSHFAATQDRRILLDIACRLRRHAPIAAPADPPPTH